ncbi:hypothetical protein [Methylorubrum extorquens]|jgi:hypothetical protein|uniref:hypothetical protein n=1 Tax=Methylorubrum extorquens TaxID=408 RepID=UPI0017A2E708|nr:hypothetical protein [Methylorubrum extorquens]MBA9070576.1 hypothetical protein [Methylobacterium sp. RAS18]UYW27264.1 hypothetical protein OKC48_01560 [Methylorubrum extorquens]UYW32845.1 hypothetical protein OKB92_01610 [Methylorubrum extorquens]
MLAPSPLLPSTDPHPHDGSSSNQLARALPQQITQDERKRLKAGQRSGSYGFEDDPRLDENDAVEQIVVQEPATSSSAPILS